MAQSFDTLPQTSTTTDNDLILIRQGTTAHKITNKTLMEGLPKYTDIQFQTVQNAIDGVVVGGSDITTRLKSLVADQGNIYGSTGEYNSGTGIGGAQQRFTYRSIIRNELSDAGWVPDTYGSNYVWGTSGDADPIVMIVQIKEGAVNAWAFGCTPDQSASTIENALIAADNYADENGYALHVPAGTYNIAPSQDIKIKAQKFSGDGYVTFATKDATVFVTTTDYSLYFDGNLREIEKFTVRNEKVADNCSGIKLRDFQFSVMRDVSIVGAVRGVEIVVRDDVGNSAGSFSSRLENITTLSCRYSVYTGGNELNAIDFASVRFAGTFSPSNTWEWAGDDAANPSYGIYIDTAQSDENSSEYFIQSLNIDGTIERHKYGAAVYIFCDDQSVFGGAAKAAVNVKNINIDGLYAERCKDVLVLDTQDKGRVQGLNVANVNASASESNATSIVTLLGNTGSGSLGAYRGVYLDSKTCNVAWNGSPNAAFQKFNIDGIGESANNSGLSLNGEIVTIPLLINDGGPVTATGGSVDVKVAMQGCPYLRKGFNHRITEVAISMDRQLSAGGADAIRIRPTTTDFITYGRDDYANQNTTASLINPLVRISDSVSEADTQTATGHKLLTTSTIEASSGVMYPNGLVKFGNGLEDTSASDRLIQWPTITNCRLVDAALQTGDITVTGYIQVEMWEDE